MEVTRDESKIGPGRDPAPLPEWVVESIGHAMAENFAKGMEQSPANLFDLTFEWDYAMDKGIGDE